MPGQQTWLDDERAFPVWDKAGKLKLPVAVQMTPDGIPLLLKIVKAFPGTNFLLDHLARSNFKDGPPYADAAALWDLAQYKNIYVKLTSRTVENCQEGKATPETFMPKLMSTFGSDHVLWGSNFPAHDDTLANIVKETLHVLASVSDADRANIMGGTALRLYPALK